MENTENLQQEIKEIYRAIEKHEAFIKDINIEIDQGENPKRHQQARILFYASIVVIAISYLFIQIKQPPSSYTVIVAFVGMLIGYLLMLSSIAANFFRIKKDLSLLIKNPLSLLFYGFRQTINGDVEFAQALQNYSVRSLVIVKNRLSNQSTTVQHRVNSLVGPLTKLGLLPGLLALSITFFNQDYHQMTIHIAIVFLVLYVIAFRASIDLPRINFYAQMLEDEIAIRS